MQWRRRENKELKESLREKAAEVGFFRRRLAQSEGGSPEQRRSFRAGGYAETPDDTEHESAGKPLRQCNLRKFHEDAEAGGDLLPGIS